MYQTDGSGAIDGNIKSAGFDYSFSKTDKKEDEKNRYGAENFPGGLFTVPNNAIASNYVDLKEDQNGQGGFIS